MNAAEPIAIDVHTHVEVSCWNPLDRYGWRPKGFPPPRVQQANTLLKGRLLRPSGAAAS